MQEDGQFDNSPEDYPRPLEIDTLLSGLEAGDPHAQEVGRKIEQVMRETRSQGNGSMFGVTSSMRNMTEAFEGLLQFLPKNFLWPTIVNVSPFHVYAEWGRDNTNVNDWGDEDNLMERDLMQGVQRGVWLVAYPDRVKMNANFRPGWPECGASAFDARTAAKWLQELTANWEWSAGQSEDVTWSTIGRM